MKSQMIAVAVLVGAGGLMLAGCASGPTATETTEATRYTVNNTETFQLLDKKVQAMVACTGLIETVDAQGRLEVAVNVKNRDLQPLVLQVGCLSKERLGAPQGIDAPWQVVQLASGATETVRFTAPDTTAKSYAVRVRLRPVR